MHAPQTRRGVLATSFGGIEVAGGGTHAETYRLNRGYGGAEGDVVAPKGGSRGDDRARQPQLYSISMTMPTWT